MQTDFDLGFDFVYDGLLKHCHNLIRMYEQMELAGGLEDKEHVEQLRGFVNLPKTKVEYYFTCLRKLRNHLAFKGGIATYLIFGNEELRSLLIYRPATSGQLALLKGFPAEGVRVRKWGAAIIAVFGDTEVEDFVLVESKDGSEPSVEPRLKKMTVF